MRFAVADRAVEGRCSSAAPLPGLHTLQNSSSPSLICQRPAKQPLRPARLRLGGRAGESSGVVVWFVLLCCLHVCMRLLSTPARRDERLCSLPQHLSIPNVRQALLKPQEAIHPGLTTSQHHFLRPSSPPALKRRTPLLSGTAFDVLWFAEDDTLVRYLAVSV